MLASTASSKLLAHVAFKEGFRFYETLTGFKYLGNKALDLENQGYHVPFAYEEALGYMCGTSLRDKDGLSALIVWAELSSEIVGRGSSVVEYLNEIYSSYGYFATNNGYFISRNPSAVEFSFNRLRFGKNSGGQSGYVVKPPGDRKTLLESIDFPQTLATYPISGIRDLTIGYDTHFPPEYLPSLPTSSSSQMITFTISGSGGEVVVTLRTSGTELWKLKYYVEGNASDYATAKLKVDQIVTALGEEWGFANL